MNIFAVQLHLATSVYMYLQQIYIVLVWRGTLGEGDIVKEFVALEQYNFQ